MIKMSLEPTFYAQNFINYFLSIFKKQHMSRGFLNGQNHSLSPQDQQQYNRYLNAFQSRYPQHIFPQTRHIIPQPIFGSQLTWNYSTQPITIKQQNGEKNEAADKKTNAQVNQTTITEKKMKLPRCSICLKKIDLKDVFKCQICLKTYHQTCYTNQGPCFRCQEKEKQKELKKQKKLQKKQEKKIIIPLTNHIFKPAMQISNAMTESQKKKLLFFQKFPYYSQGNKIRYPVEDILFDIYSDILQPLNSASYPQYIKLPHYYGSLLQIWNIISTFPLFFGVDPSFKISQLESKLVMAQIPSEFEGCLFKFINFHLADVTIQKLEQYRDQKHFNFLSLLRFCQESGFIDKVLKFCWAKFLAVIFQLQQIRVQGDEVYQKIIDKIKQMDQKGEYKFFQNTNQRFQFLNMLCNAIVDTNSFRGLLNKKNQDEKQNNKQKNQWLQTRKVYQSKLSNIRQKQKILTKQQRKIKKMIKKNAIDSEQAKKKLQDDQLQLEEQKKIITQNLKQINQHIESINTFTGFSQIWMLGRDKHKNNYWFTLDQKDRIIINVKQQWGYYPLKLIPDLLKSLNQKGIRESQLYNTIIQYQPIFEEQNINQTNQCQSIIEQPQNVDQTQFSYLQLNGITISSVQSLVFESERKMTRYLEERNARWGNQVQRAIFIQKIKKLELVEDFIVQLRTFNQKICVVQVEYKIILEDSAQQIDCKTRKIQTKIWGINQKYKHNWFDYAKSCQTLPQLFFLVSVLYLNIQKYVSKNRKLRKQYQEVRGPVKHMKTKAGEQGEEKWQQQCQVCSGVGDLLCCDSCPKVFHLNCIGLTQVPQGQFKCQMCIKKRNTRSQAKKFIVDDKRK